MVNWTTPNNNVFTNDNMKWLEDEHYFEDEVASKLNGSVIKEDNTYYVIVGNNKLRIMSDGKFPAILCRWLNETTGEVSCVFMDGKTDNHLWLAVDAAKGVL